MKKLLTILLSICMLVNIICLPATTSADVYEDVWEYTISGTEATITKYSGTETTVTVPSAVSDGINTYTVTAVGNGSGNINGNLVNVTLPSTIKRINAAAFYAMKKSGFTINFPEGLEEIGSAAFYDSGQKESLVNIVFPSTLKKIGTRAFYQCTRIKTITFNSETAPTIAVNGSKEAFWNLSGKPVIYYPENGVGYDAVAFRNMFASTNATPVEGKNALVFAYTGTSATAAPTATATPKPTLDPNATPAPTPTATPTPTPVPDSLKVTFFNNKINAKYNYSGDKAVKLIVAQYDNDGIMRQVNMSDDTQLAVDKNELCVTASAYMWTDELEPVFDSESVSLKEDDSLKILIIGNSFSGNAREYIVDIAKNLGVKKITLGNLKISGSSLSDHWLNISKDKAFYNYAVRTESQSSFSSKASVTMEYGLVAEDWDYVFLQEYSSGAAKPETYGPLLLKIIPYVKSKLSNPDAKIGWYMTWAYQSGYSDLSLSPFNGDQMVMYNLIANGTKDTIVGMEGIDLIVPAGTAVQNVRTSLIGDTITSDGKHLSTHVGCYIAGMTFVAAITGLDVNDVTWVSKSSQYPGNYLPAIKEAVTNAIKTPFSVTQSTYKE